MTQPLFGELYSSFAIKSVYIASIALFEAGSLTSALAQNAPLFIFGRALSGAGFGGIVAGGVVFVQFLNNTQPDSNANTSIHV